MSPAERLPVYSLGLEPAQFAAAFPFHFAIDEECRLIQIGPSLARICPDLQLGQSVAPALRGVRHSAPLTSDLVRENMTRFFLLEHPASGLQLRGQFLAAGDRALLFLGSTWFTESTQISAFGLRIDDFALHDPVVDLLFVLQASKSAVEDAKKLTQRLTEQKSALQKANERLLSQQDELRKLALVASRTVNAVVLTDADGRVEWVNDGFQRVTGYTLEEVKGQKPGDILQGPGTDADTVRRIREHLRRGEGFSETILNYRKDGSAYWISFEVQPLRDSGGRVTNFMAIQTDITARRATQQRLAIQFEVSRALADAAGYEKTFVALLRTVCETLGWQVAQFWQREGQVLHLAAGWAEAEFSGFLEMSRSMELPGELGLPERVLLSGNASWIPDVTRDANFPRAAAAEADGLRGTFAFPVMVHGEVWGVAEFFSRKIEEPDEAMLRTFETLGQQVGQFIVRKQAEDALQTTNMLQQAILDGASYAIISTSIDGTIQTFNRGAENMLGYTATELVGQATPALFHDPREVANRAAELSEELRRPIAAGFEVFTASIRPGQPDEREWTYIRQDGSRFPVQLTVTALIDPTGALSGYLGVASDITERQRAAQELTAAKEAAEAANRAKSDFLATISHEIRTPLNGIIGLADILAMSPLDQDQSTKMGLLIGSAQSLLELINDLLDFSKIEAGRLDLEVRDFDPTAELMGVIETFRPLASSKNLELKTDLVNLPQSLCGDSLRLRQIISNLLSNAIKFTPSGRVTLEVKAEPARAGWRLDVAVQDTGVGIGEEAMHRLFQPFTQADASVSRKFGGTGLGLAICRRLARMMGGDITVETSPQGSVFRVEVFLDEGSATPGQLPPDHLEGELPPLKVLVADDNKVNRLVATTLLHKLLAEIQTASSGAEAVELAEKENFDVIFMDMQMPGMDGLEATKRIRAGTLSKQPHIIALTANAYDTDRTKCVEAGMDGFVSKPVRLSDLRSELIRVCLTGSPSPNGPRVLEHIRSFCNSREAVLPPAEEFLASLGGEPATCRDIAEIAEADIDILKAAIEEALQGQHEHRLAESIHALRGGMSSLGAGRAAEFLHQMEKACEAGNLATVQEAWRLFQPVLASCQQELAELRAAFSGEPM